MQTPENKTRPISPRATLTQAMDLAKSGQKAEACGLFREILALQPVNQAAWLWLSAVTTDKAEAEAALNQARQINPAHPSLLQAEQWLVQRFSTAPATTPVKVVQIAPVPQPISESSNHLLSVSNSFIFGLAILAALFGLCVLFLGLISELRATALASELIWPVPSAETTQPASRLSPQLDQVWVKQDWSQAIAILENLHQLQPGSGSIKDQLSQAHIQMGIALRSRGFVEEALTHFGRALALASNQPQAKQEQRLASTYLDGIEHYQAGQWQMALNDFEVIWREDKSYPNIKDLLYSTYYNQALALQAANKPGQAKIALEAAIALHPELSDPRRLMAEIEFALAPQTRPDKKIVMVPIKDRTIVVGIAEQRMLVYEGKRRVFDFVVSTGEPGSDTAIGEFEILNKIDVAYASTWNLDMPYWMGIYWAGPLQNGIHALPIVKHTGYKLWDGYLGQRVSYGCVILSDEDAATLYDWAEVGTKIKIVPSLNQWLAEDPTAN
jgi:tetratricopeptide (TPR) repeat protein